MWRLSRVGGRRVLSWGAPPALRQVQYPSGQASLRGLRSASSAGAKQQPTIFGAYLEQSGAIWADADVPSEVLGAPGGKKFSWRIELPPERLQSLRRGDAIDSPIFEIDALSRGRFQLYPKGDMESRSDESASLWLWVDEPRGRSFRLRAGQVERMSGATEFCKLADLERDGTIEVEILPDGAEEQPAPRSAVTVHQSLQLTGLKMAEWRLFNAERLLAAGSAPTTSTPFRFHHVLLGDMYLELHPGIPHERHFTIFFLCRVPTMKLRVELSVGSSFSNSFIAQGLRSPEQHLKEGACLQVNLDAPGVLDDEGDLVISCRLEEVVALPPDLKQMIPRLDERALWPKRL